MNITKAIIILFILIVFAFINVEQTLCQEDPLSEIILGDEELDQELRWLKAETYVVTPSRIPEKIKKTASSISVVTDRQIRQMGARNLVDVVMTVPGMASVRTYGGMYGLGVRGKGGLGSNKLLMMINSHPVNEMQTGGFIPSYTTLTVDNVKRIEFLRSPGSAVYGANAFGGVINIMTKEADDIDGLELSAKAGSYDTQQYNLLYGDTHKDLEVTFNFNYFKTHGFRGLIEEDFETQLDRVWNSFGFPSNASLAPGRMKGDEERYDAALTMKYKGFKFDGRYIDREADYAVGRIPTLTEECITSVSDYYLTLSYETSIREGLDLFGKVYTNHHKNEDGPGLRPPGAFIPTPAGPAMMPDGVNFLHGLKSRRTGIEIQTTYQITASNIAVAGATYEEQKGYDNYRIANWLPTPNPNVLIPLPSMQRWPDDFVQAPAKRNFKAVFLEDIWDMTDDLRLTAGVRYDRYSDFGGEVSPRLGLTWEYTKGYDLKLLYAHAFRAPGFFELYHVDIGNPDLGPEEIDTYELSLGADFTPSLSGRIAFWRSKIKDIIIGGLPNLQNVAEVTHHGFEVEMKYDFGRGTYLAGNYDYRHLDTFSTPDGEFRNIYSPLHTGNIMANIRLNRYLNFFANCHIEDGCERNPGDSRDDMSGYAIVNATLIAKKFIKGWNGLELRGSVYNLFDKDYTEPMGTELPNDLPMPGRNFLLELKHKF